MSGPLLAKKACLDAVRRLGHSMRDLDRVMVLVNGDEVSAMLRADAPAWLAPFAHGQPKDERHPGALLVVSILDDRAHANCRRQYAR